MRPGPYFFGWCDETARVDALGAALSALVHDPPYEVGFRMPPYPEHHAAPVDEAVGTIRTHFRRADAEVFLHSTLSSGKPVDCVIRCYADKSERSNGWGPLHLHPRVIEDFAPMYMILDLGSGASSVGAEAVLAWHTVVTDIEDFLLRLCAPDASRRVSTGGCTTAWTWLAPVSMCATYHANARDIARDLALSWIRLHDAESVSRIAGLSTEALRARVEAAPAGARVVPTDKSGRSIPLSRETVLKALALPGYALLEALIAAADVPDEAWRAAEPRAEEIHNLTVQAKARGEQLPESLKGPPLWYVEMTGEHVYFLVDHAPFTIRRLPSGGVVMATHFYRTLWPLWADALSALGLMS
ncbi:hypothetical protein SOCEGT47_067190 [Sorangium cellulosum]|uniref:Uncharacterized protein n=1 Tax=Sorangium cellulosum TaxID=56 RepID=A0A4P2QA74_SORCE|nr:hypothetical protein [Sorangium cellulosum]AUX26158.1 hypothetical protein SOCEGT47_067190 [Sorangium cellulosum]